MFGVGHWGKNLTRIFAELGALRIIVDHDEKTAAKYAEMYGAVAMTKEEALASDIDGVVIAAPAEYHAQLAIEAATAGKHVYVEKPIALNEDDALAMIKATKDADRILMVGHLLQYHPVFVALREKVRAGDLGKLRYAYSHRLSTGKFRVEEDAFWSLAPHDVSMLLALFDEAPSHVRQSGLDFVTDGIADETRLDMVFPSGGRAHVFASWLHPFKEQRLVVVGENAMAVFDDVKPWDEKLALYRHVIDTSGPVPVPHKADVEYVSVPPGEPLKSECQHFLDCIANGDTPFTDGEEALRVLRVMASDTLPKPI
ncbi:hypothetical protein GCM10007854_29400 [Algimonas porphyrae]|uniref:Gfo/Idh/MocA family oxidoreductase n=1 Tax=Algimonas porphyrae TaxID=1128113 RepID=A0ABQ5V4I1_9PROT|nr:hypothetical protein GCM10007854_29400 [Algimonas porphyrae]